MNAQDVILDLENKRQSARSEWESDILSEKINHVQEMDKAGLSLDEINEALKADFKKRLCPEPLNASQWFYVEEQEPEPIVFNLFDKGSKILLAGASKAMKSFLLLQMCLAIAKGEKYFLKWEIPQRRRVLLIQVEIMPAHFQKRMKRLMDTLNITPEEIKDHLYIVNGRGSVPFTPEEISRFFDDIAFWAKKTKAEVIGIDPVYKFLLNENNPEDWKPLLAGLDQLANTTGASIIYVHHFGKGISSDRQTIDRTSGSGVVGRDMDCFISINSHKDDELRVIETVQRNYPPTEPFSCSVTNTVFRLDDAPPTLKSHNDTRNKKRPSVSEESALNFFISGAQLKSKFHDYLKDLSSEMAARSLIEGLLHSGKLQSFWKGRGTFAMIGTPAQIAKLEAEYENNKKPVQDDLSI